MSTHTSTGLRKSVPTLLQARLSELLGRPVAMPERTRAGKRQLEAFCLSWSARDREGLGDEVASIYTMTECLKAAKLDIAWKQTTFHWDVVPVNE